MPYIGIDLGTTFSAMAYLDRDGKPVTIPNAEGDLTTPSVVLFESETEVIVGREARRASLAEPDRVAEDVKRYMGDDFYPRVLLGQRLSPITLSAMILRKLMQDARARAGSIDGAVITVPAYFDEFRRQATAAAAELAGLRLLDIINEPTAAALAYAYRGFVADGTVARGQPRTVLVYDLGGGTFDVTLLRTVGGDLTVLATAGDVRLGGRDWDERLFNHLADLFVREHGDDPRDDPLSRQQLMSLAEEAKKDLSRRTHTPYVVNHAGKSLRGQITRAEFDQLTADLLFRSESRVSRVLRDAGLAWDAVDELLAVGGSTRMPQVQEMLQRISGKTPNTSVSPDEAVAHGAAIHAAIAVAAHGGEAPAAPAATPPAGGEGPPPAEPSAGQEGDALSQLAAATTTIQRPAADPAPAIDAAEEKKFLAWLGDKLVRLLRSVHTTNVNAHSLGVVAEDRAGRRFVRHLIARNSRLPAAASRCFATVTTNQRRVTVEIVEGESEAVDYCLAVGTCVITQLPAGLPRGSPIEVTFRYDRSGRLHVQAVHLASGAWAETLIQRGGGVDPQKIHLSRELLQRVSVT